MFYDGFFFQQRNKIDIYGKGNKVLSKLTFLFFLLNTFKDEYRSYNISDNR